MCQPLQRQASEPHPPSTPGCPSASSSHLCDEVASARVRTHPESFPLAAVGTWAPSSGGQEPHCHFSLVFPLKQPSAPLHCLLPLRSFALLGYGIGSDGPAHTGQRPSHLWETGGSKPPRCLSPRLVGADFRMLSAFEKYKPARGCVKLCAHKGVVPQEHANYRAVLGPCRELAV